MIAALLINEKKRRETADKVNIVKPEEGLQGINEITHSSSSPLHVGSSREKDGSQKKRERETKKKS